MRSTFIKYIFPAIFAVVLIKLAGSLWEQATIGFQNRIAESIISFLVAYLTFKKRPLTIRYPILLATSISITYAIFAVLSTLLFAGFLLVKQSEYVGQSIFLTALFNIIGLSASSVYIFAGCLGSYFFRRLRDKSISKENKKWSRVGLHIISTLFILQVISALLIPKLFPTHERGCLQVYQLTNNVTSLAKCWHNLAVMTQESKYCDNIKHSSNWNTSFSGEVSRDSCYAYVAYGKKMNLLCEQADDLINCYSTLARLERDPSVCQTLSTEYKNECINRYQAWDDSWNTQRKRN